VRAGPPAACTPGLQTYDWLEPDHIYGVWIGHHELHLRGHGLSNRRYPRMRLENRYAADVL